LIGKLRQYFEGLISIIYPRYCAACGNTLYNNETPLCLHCLANLPVTRFHSERENEVARIFWGRIPVTYATSFMYFTKDSPYRQILHEIKYRGQQELGFNMGKLFGLELRETGFATADMIHPVPLHPSKLRARGYNQSELIAKGMSAALNIPVNTGCIARVTPTRTQTRKNRYERWENVRDTFGIINSEALCNKHIILVDDVITTGATIEACADTVLKLEGVSISIASLACVKLQ
jgi:ComF family protein